TASLGPALSAAAAGAHRGGADRDGCGHCGHGADRTALPERAGLTRLLWEVDCRPGSEGNADLVGTANRAGIPIEDKGRLGVAIPVADRPGLAVDHPLLRPIPHQVTGQIAAVEVELSQLDVLRCQ